MSINLTNYLPNELSFERMKHEGDLYGEDMTYERFRLWNLECIAALTDYEYNWTVELCRRMLQKNIKLMDEEPCVVFTADGIYFDMNKNLVITNSR